MFLAVNRPHSSLPCVYCYSRTSLSASRSFETDSRVFFECVDDQVTLALSVPFTAKAILNPNTNNNNASSDTVTTTHVNQVTPGSREFFQSER